MSEEKEEDFDEWFNNLSEEDKKMFKDIENGIIDDLNKSGDKNDE